MPTQDSAASRFRRFVAYGRQSAVDGELPLARQLFDHAEKRARNLALPCIELGSRVELTENHAIFRSMGFEICGEGMHEGFDRPTTFWFRKSIAEV